MIRIWGFTVGDEMGERESAFASALSPEHRSEVIREAYRKHATELLAIEEAQQKTVLLVLGVFGAGASYLASDKARPLISCWPRWGLTALAAAFLGVAGVMTHRRNSAREHVRHLLARCEEALGLFDPDVYVRGPLYASTYRGFAKAGKWLGRTFWLAVLAGAGFIMVLWGR